MDVSIVIVSFNTKKLLLECVESIKSETKCSYEIIVVDNGSVDNSGSMIKTRHSDVILYENKENVGFAKANNQGFALAKGRYFFMLNPDTVVLDGAIDKLVSFMDNNKDVGICGPQILGPGGELQYSCDHFPSFWNNLWSYTTLNNLFPWVPMFKRNMMRYWDYSGQRDVDRIIGCALMIRSDLFKRLGGLDNAYFMYFEETDLCYRSKMIGFRTVYVPHCRIVHYGGQSAKHQNDLVVINSTIVKYYYASQYYFFRKNYGFFSMVAIRTLDMIYGASLMLRNVFRADANRKKNNLLKAKSILFGSFCRTSN